MSEHKIALVTGASRGIGAAIAEALGKSGLFVVGTATSEAGALAITARFAEAKINGIGKMLNVTDGPAVEALVAEIAAQHGPVAVLVNNAGITKDNLLMRMSDEEWFDVINTNLSAVYRLSKACLRGMMKQRWGRIVNIASVHGHKIIPGCFPYPVAKHALIGLTRSLGIEYARRGIRVNSISPGLILTEAIQNWLASCPNPEAERQRQADLLPCGRIGLPEEVAQTALFLASDEARFINATDILIDGGRSQLYHE